jgi:hypothetical protein
VFELIKTSGSVIVKIDLSKVSEFIILLDPYINVLEFVLIIGTIFYLNKLIKKIA